MRIVIDGAGEVGSHLAKLLRREKAEVVVIDSDAKKLQNLTAYADVQAIQGEPVSLEAFERAQVKKSDLFIAVVPNVPQEVNILACQVAKKMGSAKVIARINSTQFTSPHGKALLKELGIDLAFYPEKIAADEIVDIIRHNASADTMDFAGGKLQVAAFRLGEESDALDTTLVEFVRNIPTEAASSFRVIAISRDGKTIIPRFDTKFKYGDLVYTISKREAMETVLSLLGVKGFAISSVMVVGGGDKGSMAAKKLSNTVKSVKVVEKDHERCINLTESLPDNVLIVNGDGRNPDFLNEEGIRDYDAFVAVTGNDEANILACVAAKRAGVHRTIAEVENLEYIRFAEEMGVDNIINKKLMTAGRIFKFTLSDKARFVRYMSGTDAEVVEYTVSEKSAAIKGTLRDLTLPAEAVVGGVIRGTDAFIAVGSTQLQSGDHVAVFALPSAVAELDKFFK